MRKKNGHQKGGKQLSLFEPVTQTYSEFLRFTKQGVNFFSMHS